VKRFIPLLLAASVSLAAAAENSHQVDPNWPKLPPNHVLGLCAGVGVDSQHRVFVFHRSGRLWSNPFPKEPIPQPTVSVIDSSSGKLIDSWGENTFIMPHGLTIDRENHVWLTDVGLHQVFKFTADGKLLMTLGEAGVSANDQAHFNLPTDVAVLKDGSFYVSDGYKNTRVVKFSAEGRYEFEWGTKGSGPGEFNLPHGIAVDDAGRVYVCDRTNSRLQVFDAKGKFLAEWKGAHLGRPYGVDVALGRVLVIDGGEQTLKAGDRGRAIVLDLSGQVIESFGSLGAEPGQFRMGHDIAADSNGDIYVAEGAGARVQKFVRQP